MGNNNSHSIPYLFNIFNIDMFYHLDPKNLPLYQGQNSVEHVV